VADAVEVGEHRHAGLVLHALDQSLAAARDDHVDQARRAQHRARPPSRSCVGISWTVSPGHACRFETCASAAWIARFEWTAFAAAAQQHGVAAAQAQRGRRRR
jgi:hypothetical protein